jgi:hypothetical protein
LENFPFCPADAAIVANIPLADSYTEGVAETSSSSLYFWPSFTTEDYWPSAVLNLVNT